MKEQFKALIDAGEWTKAYRFCQEKGLDFAGMLEMIIAEAVQNATTVVQSTVQELEAVQDRLDTMYNMIQPLLNNLVSGMEKHVD